MRPVIACLLLILLYSCGGTTQEDALAFAEGTNLIIDKPTDESDKLVRMTYNYIEYAKVGLTMPEQLDAMRAQQEVTVQSIKQAQHDLKFLEEADPNIDLKLQAAIYLDTYGKVFGEEFTELLALFEKGFGKENRLKIAAKMEEMFSKIKVVGEKLDAALSAYAREYRDIQP